MAMTIDRPQQIGKYDPTAYSLDLSKWPNLVTGELPGPKSKEMHARASEFIRGLSGQVKLFPVVFEKGSGCTLEDIQVASNGVAAYTEHVRKLIYRYRALLQYPVYYLSTPVFRDNRWLFRPKVIHLVPPIMPMVFCILPWIVSYYKCIMVFYGNVWSTFTRGSTYRSMKVLSSSFKRWNLKTFTL